MNTHFNKLRISGWTLYISKIFPVSNINDLPYANGFNGVRGPFEKVDSSRFAKVYKCSASFNGLKHDFYFKEFIFRSFLDFLKHIFRQSRGQRSLNAALVLNKCGLLCPEVVAVGLKKIGPFPLKNFLLTRQVKDSKSLYSYIPGNWTCLKDRRIFISELGKIIGKMHSAGICHGDLRPGNILVRKAEEGFLFYFLDNERSRKYSSLPPALRLKNLVQINMFHKEVLSRTDRMRFFKSYLKENPVIKDRKALAKKVAQRTAERLSSKITTNQAANR